MSANKLVLGSVIFVLLLLSLACGWTGGGLVSSEPLAEQSTENAVATSISATMAAVEMEEQVPTSQPIAEVEALEPMAPTADLLGISFYFNPQLAQSLSSDVVPANEADAPWYAAPEYRQITFNQWILGEVFPQPTIRVFSVEEFRQINPNVAERLDALRACLEDKSTDQTGLAVPEIFNAGQLFQSNIRYLEFQNGNGARWLSQYGQALFPIGYPQLFYTYQGFTDDGAYYLSVILPVNHTILPPLDSVTLDDAFYNNYESYAGQTRALLEAQPDASFVPSLEQLDQMMESITIQPE